MRKNLLVFCFSLLSTMQIQARNPERDLVSRWSPVNYEIISDRYDESVKDGFFVLRGIVIDNGNQKPLGGSKIINGDTSVSVISDSAGLFSVRFPVKDSTVYCLSYGYSEVVIQGPFKNRHVIQLKIFVEQGFVAYKPVIYAYNSPGEIELSLKPHGNFTFTYPESTDGNWNLYTNKDGSLTNKSDGKKYPYLFWEGSINQLSLIEKNNSVEGYLIKTDTCISFLENTLSAYGLNEKESADFITFWGPKMINSPYAVVQFLINEDYEKNVAELAINPQPETLLRLYMYLIPLQTDQTGLQITQPQIQKTERTGFTVIEWGGSVLSDALNVN